MEHSVISPLCDSPPGKYNKYREDTTTTAYSLQLDLKELDNHFEGFLCDKISCVCHNHLLSTETQQISFIFGLSTHLYTNYYEPELFKHINTLEDCSTNTREFHNTSDIISYVSQRISVEDASDFPSNNSVYDLKKHIDPNFFTNGQILIKFFGKYWMIPTIISIYFDNFLTLIRSLIGRFKRVLAKDVYIGPKGVNYCFNLASKGKLAQAVKIAYRLLHTNDLLQSNKVEMEYDDNTEKMFHYNHPGITTLIELFQHRCTLVTPNHFYSALKTTFNFVGDLSKRCNIVEPKNIEVENLLGCLSYQAGNFFHSIFHLIRALSLNPYDINTLTNLVMLYDKFGLQAEMASALLLLNTITQGDNIDPSVSTKVKRVTSVIISKSLGRDGAEFAKSLITDCINSPEILENNSKDLHPRLLCNLIEVHIRLAEYKEGIKLANEMTDKYPNFAPLWFISAKIKFHNNDFTGALGDILHSIKLDPYSPSSYLYACKILTKLNYLPAAWFSFKNCVYSDPDAIEFHLQCGKIVCSFGLENNLAWIYPNTKLSNSFLTTFKSFDVTNDGPRMGLFKICAKKSLLIILFMGIVECLYYIFQ